MRRMFLLNDIDRIEQPLQIALWYKRGPEVRHDEIPHEHHALIAQINEHGVVGFSSLHGDQLDSRASDGNFGAAVDSNVRFETAYVVKIEAFTEERFRE